MKMTLLEMTQRILESIDSDEVSSISDTTESLAVANIIKETYSEIIAEVEPKETTGLWQVTASTDPSLPTVAYLPDNVARVYDLRYNTGDLPDVNLRKLDYVPIGDFFELLNGLDVTNSWVGSMSVPFDGGTYNFKFRNDKHPTYWTSPDDRTLIFDSFDNTVESTITAERSYGFGALVPVFSMEDDFVPHLDSKQFPLLLQSAKATASVELKQLENTRAERKERRHRILAYKTEDNTDPRPELLKQRGFGRHGR